ncbi:ElyC/SanA/YdcF family protein [Roseibium sp.]|uniref:ElyC/SanA/YdcF family protein n=2 Tax=Roseibium sp. TaxID=1936156 RepID=UPI003265F594
MPKLSMPPALNDELIHEITELCFYESPRAEGNILVTFGTNLGVTAAAHKTMAELKKGLTKILALTGGMPSALKAFSEIRPGLSEAQAIYDLIFSDPATCSLAGQTEYLFLERRSLNTKENVANLHDRLRVVDDDRVVCVCHAYAAQRVLLTMKSFFPDIEVMVSPYEIEKSLPRGRMVSMTRQGWFRSDLSRGLVWGEVLRLEAYGAMGEFSIEPVRARLERIRMLAG